MPLYKMVWLHSNTLALGGLETYADMQKLIVPNVTEKHGIMFAQIKQADQSLTRP